MFESTDKCYLLPLIKNICMRLLLFASLQAQLTFMSIDVNLSSSDLLLIINKSLCSPEQVPSTQHESRVFFTDCRNREWLSHSVVRIHTVT